MLPKFIRTPDDIVTSHRAVCDGFLSQALTKTEKAAPYVERAKEFWRALQDIDNNIDSILNLKEFHDELVAAAGFSEKARSHLTRAELDNALQQVSEKLIATGSAFREEIFYRYLLTKGDALGGQMRNFTGAAAGVQFANALLAALKPDRSDHQIHRSSKSEKIQRIDWPQRRILFDVKPKFIDKNIDVILLNSTTSKAKDRELLESPQSYIACGELKGGIDPAGADEHWKTAGSALNRIRDRFQERKAQCPALFFVGAAIENAMAKEIFDLLQNGSLSHAANLTVEDQVADLANWLVTL